MFRKLMAACAGLAMMWVAGTANAALIVVGGALLGATDVEVNGAFFDVEFLDGTCVGLFPGCDATTDFAFDTQGGAIAAVQALLDSVFIDQGPPNLFDTFPSSHGGAEMSLFAMSSSHIRLWAFLAGTGAWWRSRSLVTGW